MPIILTRVNLIKEFCGLNYHLTSKSKFSIKPNLMRYPVYPDIQTYIREDLEFIISVFSWCIPLDHKIYTKYKKSMRIVKLYKLIEDQKHLIFLKISSFHFIKSLFLPYNFLFAFNHIVFVH